MAACPPGSKASRAAQHERPAPSPTATFTPRPESAAAPDDRRRPRAARLAGRAAHRCPREPPSSGATRATPAGSATSRARSTCRSAAMHRAGHAAPPRRRRHPRASSSANVTRGRRLVCYDGSGVACGEARLRADAAGLRRRRGLRRRLGRVGRPARPARRALGDRPAFEGLRVRDSLCGRLP